MEQKKKSFYLSYRIKITLLAVFCLLAGALVFALVHAVSNGESVGFIVLALVFLLIGGGVFWLWIYIPFRKQDHDLWLLVKGNGQENLKEPICAVSSAEETAIHQMKQALAPSHLFNLNKRQVQYIALQNQINPHFLYNTLESIRSEALLAELDSVADMTEALATFFRYTISKVENLVTVEEELQNCETYFHIQQYRFGDRLRLNIKCAPEDMEELYRCRIPKLTLQPILENSIIHGTELKIGTGNLTIQLQRTDKRLLIQVSDDGVGMDEETLNKLNSRLGRGGLANYQPQEEGRGGVALVNVDNRIRLLFGEEYGLCVYSLVGMGTDVEITLPLITNDWEVKNPEALQ